MVSDDAIRLALEAVLDAYFVERDLDAVLRVMCEDVRVLSPSSFEPVVGMDDLSRLIALEFEYFPNSFSFEMSSYGEWMLADGVAQCASTVVVYPERPIDTFGALLLCITATFRFDEGVWKLLSMHSSSPWRTGIDDSAVLAVHAHIKGLEQLRREAATDALTGILNRRETTRLIDAASKDAEGMLLLVDVDDFKSINDRYGHQAGDAALVALAWALEDNVRHDDVVGRLGGDEFVVYLSRLENRDVVKSKVELFGKEFAEALANIAPGLSVTLSVGVAQRGTGESFDELYRRADAALYKAKHSGKATIFFDDEMNDDRRIRFTMCERPENEKPDCSA